MAFGLTPNAAADIALDGLTPAQYLALCVLSARSLDWDVKYVSDGGMIALTSKKLLKRKQKVIIRISSDLARMRSESIGNEMVDYGRNRKNIERFTGLLGENRAGYSPEQLDQTYEELKPDLVPSEQDILLRAPETTAEKWGGFFSLFVPREGYVVTPLLVDLNLAIFLLMCFSGVSVFAPTTQNLIQWGANVRVLTLDGQWWRILTCVFVHIGVFHVLFNMYALLYIGVLLERKLGWFRFLVAYLLTGIMASMASLYWHPNVLSAGASGAIFGMYGVFLALLTTNLIEKVTRSASLASIGIFVAYNLLYGTKSGVDNAAHVGGLLSGIVIGYLFYPGLRRPEQSGLRYFAVFLSALLVGAVTVIGFKKIPNGYALFQHKMDVFVQDEKKALLVIQNAGDLSRPALVAGIRDTGLYYWNDALRVLNEAGRLDVTQSLKDRTGVLIRYCDLRILSYNYIARTMADTAAATDDSLSIYNGQIKEVMDSLRKGM